VPAGVGGLSGVGGVSWLWADTAQLAVIKLIVANPSLAISIMLTGFMFSPNRWRK